MKYLKLLLITSSFFYTIQLFSQNWVNSGHIKASTSNAVRQSILDNQNNYYAVGTFSGTLNPGNYISKLADIYIIKYNNTLTNQWTKQITGAGNNTIPDIVVDNNSNIFISGTYDNVNKFTNSDSLITVGLLDCFLSKYSSTGTFLWGIPIGSDEIAGPKNDQVSSTLVVDKDQNIIISMRYKDTIKINNTIYKGKAKNVYNIIIAKLDNNGNFIWVKNIESTGDAEVTNIAAFSDGYYYTGTFKDTLYLDETYQDIGNKTKPFIFKTNLNGDIQWSRRTYGDGNDGGGSITEDRFGNIFTTGYFNSSSFTVDSTNTLTSPHALIRTGTSNYDIFLLKYNKDGNLQWSKKYGLDGLDWARSIFQRNDILYITGYFSDKIIFGTDTLTSSSSSDWNFFIGTFDTDGNKLRAVGLSQSGTGREMGASIAVCSNNNAYVSGYFESPTIKIGDSIFNRVGGTRGSFVARYQTQYTAIFNKIKNVSCKGNADGQLQVKAYFGVPPYTYKWSHDTITTDTTSANLAPGTYYATVTDSRALTTVATGIIVEPNPLLINQVITHVTCPGKNNGAITSNISGGTSPYVYYWKSTGSGIISQDPNQSALTVGNVYLTVTDKNGCETQKSMVLTEPADMNFKSTVITPVNPTGANNGAITLNTTGGAGSSATFSYSWNAQSPVVFTSTSKNISGRQGGLYYLTVTDNNACTYDTNFVIQDTGVLIAYISDYNHVKCNGESNGKAWVSSLNGHGNISYLWKNSGGTTIGNVDSIINLASGTFSVTVTDGSARTATAQVKIEQSSAAISIFDSPVGALCYGIPDGMVEVVVLGGKIPMHYKWSNDSISEDLVNCLPGTYTLTVTDYYGCTVSLSTLVNSPSQIIINFTIDTTIKCFDDLHGAITASALGGTPSNAAAKNYFWNDQANQTTQKAISLPAGTYTVTAVDYNGCVQTKSISLTQPDSIQIIPIVKPINCNGNTTGEIHLTVTGGKTAYSYSWSNGKDSAAIHSLANGKYNVTVTDANLCTSKKDSIAITTPATIQITNTIKTDITTCYGANTGQITITATGGSGSLSYQIPTVDTNITGVFTGLVSDTFYIFVTDTNKCNPAKDTVTITQPTQSILISNIDSSLVKCFGDSTGTITVNATGGIGTLRYIISPAINDSNTTGLFTKIPKGKYIVNIKDANNCNTKTDSIVITEPTDLLITSVDSTNGNCKSDSSGTISVSATGGTGIIKYILNPLSKDSNMVGVFTKLVSGNYIVLAKDANQCTKTSHPIAIVQPAVINITSIDSTVITGCAGDSTGTITVNASGGTGLFTYTILPAVADSNQLGLFTKIPAGNYSIIVRDTAFCSDTVYPVVITEPTALTINSINVTNTTSQTNQNGQITITASGGTGATKNYTLSPGSILNNTGIFTSLGKGKYRIEIKDENDCIINSDSITVNISGLKEIELNYSIKIFPNPTNRILSVLLTNPVKIDISILIINELGQVIYTTEDKNINELRKDIDLTNNPSGWYTIKILSGNELLLKDKIILIK